MNTMGDISLTLQSQDAKLLLTVMSQVNCQGKEGAIQLLRILHALEAAIESSDEEGPDSDD